MQPWCGDLRKVKRIEKKVVGRTRKSINQSPEHSAKSTIQLVEMGNSSLSVNNKYDAYFPDYGLHVSYIFQLS